jgi:hypothetical protein
MKVEILSRDRPILCERCDRRAGDDENWDIEHIAGFLVGFVCPECRTPRDEFEDTILETMDLWDENESPLQAVQRMGAALTQLYPTAELMEGQCSPARRAAGRSAPCAPDGGFHAGSGAHHEDFGHRRRPVSTGEGGGLARAMMENETDGGTAITGPARRSGPRSSYLAPRRSLALQVEATAKRCHSPGTPLSS